MQAEDAALLAALTHDLSVGPTVLPRRYAGMRKFVTLYPTCDDSTAESIPVDTLPSYQPAGCPGLTCADVTAPGRIGALPTGRR
jgi:hypothetical protein